MRELGGGSPLRKKASTGSVGSSGFQHQISSECSSRTVGSRISMLLAEMVLRLLDPNDVGAFE